MVTLLETRADRIRGCANPECVLWFLDTSRPGTRRWCSMASCGNRDKAVRHGRSHR
jgi:predicted RNA-binding Zn ribbon-like protein